MRKKLSKLVTVTAAVMLGVLMTGCSLFGDFDATKYVQATLDLKYNGDTKGYTEITEASDEEAQKLRDDVVTETLNTFATSLSLDDEEKTEYEELFIKYMADVKYEVKEAKKESGDKFTVDVVITPLKPFTDQISEIENSMMEDLEKRQGDGEFDGMSQSEITEVVEKEYKEAVYDVMKNAIENPEYADETTVTVTVQQESGSNYYAISESDLDTVDNALFGL